MTADCLSIRVENDKQNLSSAFRDNLVHGQGKKPKQKKKRGLVTEKHECTVLFLKGTPHPFHVSHVTADFLSCSPLLEVAGIWASTLLSFTEGSIPFHHLLIKFQSETSVHVSLVYRLKLPSVSVSSIWLYSIYSQSLIFPVSGHLQGSGLCRCLGNSKALVLTS